MQAARDDGFAACICGYPDLPAARSAARRLEDLAGGVDPCIPRLPCTLWPEFVCVGQCSSVAKRSVAIDQRPVIAVFAQVVAAMRARRGRGTRITRLKTS